MKRIIIPIVFLISLAIILFIVFTNANSLLTEKRAKEIGEEKYLKFLWIVDGAFNSNRLDGDFTVNGKKLDNKDKLFTCKYKNSKSSECIGNNFETEFKNLFSKKISYEKVYSDGAIYSWITYVDGKYVFNNTDSCSINRMNTTHELEVVSIENDKLVLEVKFKNNSINQVNTKNFELILEDNEWKISNAFYYDICGMQYVIGLQ